MSQLLGFLMPSDDIQRRAERSNGGRCGALSQQHRPGGSPQYNNQYKGLTTTMGCFWPLETPNLLDRKKHSWNKKKSPINYIATNGETYI